METRIYSSSKTGNCLRYDVGIVGIRWRQCSGPAPALHNHNLNNFLAFAQAAFDAKFGAIWRKKFLVQFHNTCEILGDLIVILSQWWWEQSDMWCEHKTRPMFPSNVRVPQGNIYVSKGKAKCPGRIFHQMWVWCDKLPWNASGTSDPYSGFFLAHSTEHAHHRKRTSCNILHLSLFNFAKAKPAVFFPISETTSR